MNCPCCGTKLVMTSQLKLVDPTSKADVVVTLQETRVELNRLRKQLLQYSTSPDGFSNDYMTELVQDKIEQEESDEKLLREILLSFGQDTTGTVPPAPGRTSRTEPLRKGAPLNG